MGQTAHSLTCSIMEKPHTGLDDCLRILLSCFRARNSGAVSCAFHYKYTGDSEPEEGRAKVEERRRQDDETGGCRGRPAAQRPLHGGTDSLTTYGLERVKGHHSMSEIDPFSTTDFFSRVELQLDKTFSIYSIYILF